MDENLETFFVYRSISSNESWGAVLGCSPISSLPNANFLMKVFANNEKEAIARARDLYQVIHKYDSDKDNVRRFACSALKATIKTKPFPRDAANIAMEYAVAMNEVFTEHFDKLDKQNNLPELIEQAEKERKENE